MKKYRRILYCLLSVISLHTQLFCDHDSHEKKKELKLSLTDCINKLLTNDQKIIEKEYNIKISEQNIRFAETEFIPYFTNTLSFKNNQIPAYSELEGAELNKQKDVLCNFGIEKKIKTGGTYYVNFNSLRHGSNSQYDFFNPYYQSDLDLTLVQPLLKGFGKKQTCYYIDLGKGCLQISKIELLNQMSASLTDLINLYWEVYLAEKTVHVRKKILKYAEEIYSMNKTKNKLGELSEIELSQAKLGVIDKKEKLIKSESDYELFQNKLRNIIINDSDADYYYNCTLIPVDTPTLEYSAEDINSYYIKALSNNYNYQLLNEEIKQNELQLTWEEKQKYPELNLVSSVGLNGLSDTYSSDISYLSKGRYHQWEIGLLVKIPLEKNNYSAKYNIALFELKKKKNQLSALKKELTGMICDYSVKIETAFKKYNLSRESALIAKNKLQAEKEKYKLGIINTYNMLQYIEDYSQIEISVLENMVNFTKNKTELKNLTGELLNNYNIRINEDSDYS